MSAATTFETAPTQPLRICSEDGTLHFSDLKRLSLSGRQFLHSVNNPMEATRQMLIGTIVHMLVLGPCASGRPLVKFSGKDRRAKGYAEFEAANKGADIATASEWAEAQAIARAVLEDPVAQARLTGARFETPLTWEDGGVKCSTRGIDVVTSHTPADLADLKLTSTCQPNAWMRQAFRMHYCEQLVFYRRGARANGIDVRGLFLLGAEYRAPYEVVELELTEGMIDYAERNVSLWLEKYRTYRDSNQWPGYAQAPIPFDVPAWLRAEDGDEDDDEDVEAVGG